MTFSLLKQLLFAISVFCCISGSVYAYPEAHSVVAELREASTQGHKNELPELIKAALKSNSKIRALHDEWVAETHTIPQARSLPDPEIAIGYINLIGNDVFETPLQGLENIGAVQQIPFPGKLYMRWKIAQISAKEVHARFRAESFDVIANLKHKYYQLYFTNRSIEIYEKNKTILETMRELADSRNKSGNAAEQDMLLATTEISRLEMKLIILNQEAESLVAEINEIIERNLDTPVHTPGSLKLTPLHYHKKQLEELVKDRSPDIEARRQAMRKERKEISLSKMDYFPDIEAEADKLHDNKLNADGYFMALKVSMPLYFLDKQNNAVKASVARYNSALEHYQDLYYDLAYDVRNAYLIIQRANTLIKFTQNTIIPQAKATFASSKKAYESGGVDFLTFLHNLLILQQSEIDYETEVTRRQKRIADIEQAIGMFL